MSKFQSTISTVAALASIFGAAAAGWKLAQMNSEQPPTQLDQKLEVLEKKLDEAVKGDQTPEQLPQAPVAAPPVAPILTPATPPTPPPPVTDETSQSHSEKQESEEPLV